MTQSINGKILQKESKMKFLIHISIPAFNMRMRMKILGLQGASLGDKV